MTQLPLAITLSQRTVLVTADTARAALGVDADTIAAMIDDGRIRWAWDISAGQGEVRAIRIWARDLIHHDACLRMYPADAIDHIIATTRDRMRAVEVCQLLLCSRPHIHALLRLGHLTGDQVGHTAYIHTVALRHFLSARLLSVRP